MFLGQVIPLLSLHGVRFHPESFDVEEGQVVLCCGFAFLGGHGEPFDGFGIVLLHAVLPDGIDDAEEALCVDVTLAGRLDGSLDVWHCVALLTGLRMEGEGEKKENE